MFRFISAFVITAVGVFYVIQDGSIPSSDVIQDIIGTGILTSGLVLFLEAAMQSGARRDDKKQFAELLKEVKQLRAQLPPTRDTNAPSTP